MSALDQISRYDFNGVGPTAPPAGFQWYHLSLTTYGAWLYGDERGFRTRRHREHVDGDYKHRPPAGTYDGQRQRSMSLLQHPEVSLAPRYREVVGMALVDRLRQLGAFVLTTGVASRHVHCELSMPFTSRIEWVSAAKRHTWFEMRDAGWKKKLWGLRKKLVPIRTRSHQQNAFDYIVRHANQGAWVWVWEGVSDRRLSRVFHG